MDDKTELTYPPKHGKLANWKRKGKLSELDRLKKRQKELHIMKLSQEWDARRQKRKMDRIQWLQQRKDQVITQNDPTEATQGSEKASSDDESEEQVVLAKANNPPVSTISSQQITHERLSIEPSESLSTEDDNRTDENAPVERNICEDVQPLCSAEDDVYTNQVYSKSVVVKTERQESVRFSNSNCTSEPQQSNSRNSTRVHERERKRRKKENQDLRRGRTVENPAGFQSPPEPERKASNAYESLVNMVNSQPAEHIVSVQPSSVIVQAMMQSGLDEEEVDEDEDEDDDEPSLLMASEPVRFEEVLQGGGTSIQRLPTQSVDLMSNHHARKHQDVATDKLHAHRSHSRDSMEDNNNRIRKADEGLKNQPYPKIKQCYSLMAQDNKTSRSSPLPSPSSTSTGSPVTCTIGNSSPESNTVNNDARHHPVAQATSTGSEACPPSGYLVPVYKPSQDEVVYAFVPNAGERGHVGHPRLPDTGKLPTNSLVFPRVEEQFTGYSGYPTGRAPTAVIHHRRNLSSSLERATYPQKVVDSHQPTNVTWVNVQPTSIREKREYPTKGAYTPTAAVREIPVSSPLTSGNLHPVKQRETEVIVKPRQNPSPVVTMVNGYSPVQTPTHMTDSASNGALLRSSPLSNTPTDSINNPTAVYVRPRLVPREIVVPYHAGSGNVPIVEYIKTDVICNKDLANWTAQNVAEFISATDCSDSAKIFVEQDIDGKAVLLLSQDIFVNRLNLKLGTAIKLYNHIANLRSALLM